MTKAVKNKTKMRIQMPISKMLRYRRSSKKTMLTETIAEADRRNELIMWLLCKNHYTAAIAFTFQHAESKLTVSNWAQYCFQEHVLRITPRKTINHPIHKAFNLHPQYMDLYKNNVKCKPNNTRYPQRLFIAFLDMEANTPPPSVNKLREMAEFIAQYTNEIVTYPCLDKHQPVVVNDNFLQSQDTSYSQIMDPSAVIELIRPRLSSDIKLDDTLYNKHRLLFESLFAEKTLDCATAQATGAPRSMLTPEALHEEHLRFKSTMDNSNTK